MVKLKYDKLSLQQVSFKLVTKTRKTSNNAYKKITKRITGICKLIDNKYVIIIDGKRLRSQGILDKCDDKIVLPFTEESYNLKGVKEVFYRNPVNYHKYFKLIRNEATAKFSPGNEENFIPFYQDRICSGNIVEKNGVRMFDFYECIAPTKYKEKSKDEE
jgi:hypothetical protein